MNKKTYTNNKSPNKKIIATIIILVILTTILVLVLITTKNSSSNRSDYWYILARSTQFTGIGVIGSLFALAFFFLEYYFSFYWSKFKSIKAECYYYKEKFPESPHSILSILNQTQTDCFVLAYFKKENEIKPAVYTIRKKQITHLNLRIKETYFKKIYLNKNESEKYVRAYRIKNNSTNSQMLFFSSDIKPLKIQINNKLVPKIDCGNKTGKFNIYGITELESNSSVNINDCDYSLTETTVQNLFINSKEI